MIFVCGSVSFVCVDVLKVCGDKQFYVCFVVFGVLFGIVFSSMAHLCSLIDSFLFMITSACCLPHHLEPKGPHKQSRWRMRESNSPPRKVS